MKAGLLHIARRALILHLVIIAGAGCSEVIEPTMSSAESDMTSAIEWLPSSHALGRGVFLPANVQTLKDVTHLVVSGQEYSGAEIMSRDAYGLGTFAIRGRCSVPAGAICAFFLYEAGQDHADEIDIEILPGSNEIWFTIWNKGRQVFHSSKPLTFDAGASAHTYSIQRGAGEVRFLVDDVVWETFASEDLPRAVMPVLANAWWPTWLDAAGGSGAWEIDCVGTPGFNVHGWPQSICGSST